MKKIIKWYKNIVGITRLESKIITLQDNILFEHNHLSALIRKVDLFSQVINVGVDVHQRHGRSWAVVCIQGKADYIAFVDLDPNEIRTIQQFLRNFERNNTTIDAPKFPKDIFFKL